MYKYIYKYFNNCVGWERSDVDSPGGLSDMIDMAIDISRETFLKNVDKDDMKNLEKDFGYANNSKNGLTMVNDYHVSYHRSKLHGKRVYFFCHSCIEYIFTWNRGNND